MSKEKVTLTLDAEKMAELRKLVGARSLSSTVDIAIAAELARRKHMTALDAWLAELAEKHGPLPLEAADWATRVVNEWVRPRPRRRKAG